MVISLGLYQMYGNRSMHWYKCPVCDEIIIGDLGIFKRQKSCGCANGRPPSHGHSISGKTSPTYNSWMGLRRRCLNKNNIGYHKYGGSGITHIGKWETFEGFLEDMGERPIGMTLDRIDNSKGYSKENCRWATKLQQTQNRRTTIRLIISEGVEMTAKEIADLVGLSYSSVARCIRRGKGKDLVRRILLVTRENHEIKEERQ